MKDPSYPRMRGNVDVKLLMMMMKLVKVISKLMEISKLMVISKLVVISELVKSKE